MDDTTRQVDRGAHSELTFHKCAKGFVLMTNGPGLPRTYAFADIGSLAAWLVAEYGEQRPLNKPWYAGSTLGETVHTVDGENYWLDPGKPKATNHD